MGKFVTVSAFLLVMSGCASNGGGYVVGNSAIPQGSAQKMAEGQCPCGKKAKEGKSCDQKDHASCENCGCKH